MAKNGRDKHQGEVIKMFTRAGYFCRQNYAGFYAPTGESDLFVGSPAHSAFVEVKTAKGSFNLAAPAKTGDGWREDQRDWATWARAEYGIDYWIAVMYITDRSPWPRIKRDLFLFPYSVLLTTHDRISEHQNSLPYDAQSTNRIAMRTLTATGMWPQFRCHYAANEGWSLPEAHPFFYSARQMKESA